MEFNDPTVLARNFWNQSASKNPPGAMIFGLTLIPLYIFCTKSCKTTVSEAYASTGIFAPIPLPLNSFPDKKTA